MGGAVVSVAEARARAAERTILPLWAAVDPWRARGAEIELRKAKRRAQRWATAPRVEREGEAA